MAEPQVDTDLIDEAVLALMFLTLHRPSGDNWRAWKGFEWETLGRLYDKDLIYDLVGKAKSVMLTDEGRRRCEEAFYRLVAKRDEPVASGV